jgi:hypothetical protein
MRHFVIGCLIVLLAAPAGAAELWPVPEWQVVAEKDRSSIPSSLRLS